METRAALPTKNEAIPSPTRSAFDVAEEVLRDPRELARLMRMARLRFGIGADDAQDLLQEAALDIVR